MLATLANASCNNWVELLPFVQLAHITAYNKTPHETPHFLMFGRRVMLPVDVILGMPTHTASHLRQVSSRRTADNLKLGYEITRRSLRERAENQTNAHENMTFPSFQPGDRVRIHRPYTEADGPNPKLISPWRGPFVVRSRLSPAIYSVSKGDQPEGTTIHLACIKPYYAPPAAPTSDFDALDDLFLGTKIPLPDFENVASQVRIGNFVVKAMENHKRAPGKPSLTNFQYFFFTFKDYTPSQGATSTLHHSVFK